jgi:hypothetical protein
MLVYLAQFGICSKSINELSISVRRNIFNEWIRQHTTGKKKSVSQRIFSVLTIPAMIAGAILGTLMFSIFFAVLLIPMGVIGFRAWRLMKIAKQKARDQSIDAEFTVIDDRDNQ